MNQLITGIAAAILMSMITIDKPKIHARQLLLENLTRSEWRLVAIGVDVNENGRLETIENTIQSCQEDDVYAFDKTGHAIYSDDGNSCGSFRELLTSWKLLSNGKIIEISSAIIEIVLLDSERMVLAVNQNDGKHMTKHLSVFSH